MNTYLLSKIRSAALRLLRWTLLCLLVGLSPAAAQIPDDIQRLLHHRGHALLIGVSNYTGGWPQLPNVETDLRDLKAGLEPYFETVDVLPDPTVATLRERMSDFLLGQWNKPGERLFIYYSGHGFTAFNQSSRENDGYITGSDTPGKAVVKAVSFYDVDSWSRQTNALHVLMVFDSCFSGSLFQTLAEPEEPPKNDLDNVRTLLRKPMRYYITAGRQNEEVAADSTFATLLLRGLRGAADLYHEGIISADELGSYLYHEVPKYSPRPQTPQYKSIGNATLSEGQFFFLTDLAPRPAPASALPRTLTDTKPPQDPQSTPPPSYAQSIDVQKQALALIIETADKICNVITDKGTASSSDVKGDINAQLSGLASKLAATGITGTASIINEAYQGTLRKDLTALLTDNSACKTHVFDTLQSKLLTAITPPPPTQKLGSTTVGVGSTPHVSNIQQELDLSGGQSILLTDDRIIFTVIGHPFAANGNVIGVKVEGKVKVLTVGSSVSFSYSEGYCSVTLLGLSETGHGGKFYLKCY